jgi:hypothetical protein
VNVQVNNPVPDPVNLANPERPLEIGDSHLNQKESVNAPEDVAANGKLTLYCMTLLTTDVGLFNIIELAPAF